MRSPLVPVLLACAVLFVACGDSATGPVASPAIDFAAEARRLVGDAVFSAEDLPAFEPLGADGLQTQAGLSDQCDIFDAGVIFPEAVATADSGAYGGGFEEQLVNLAGIYRTADDASQALVKTRDLRVRCEAEFEVAVEQVARDFLSNLGIDLGLFSSIEVAISDYEAPPVGDEITAYRMRATVNLVITSQEYNLHAIVAREGRAAGALVYGRLGPLDDNVEVELLRLMEAKLSAVNASLPE